MENESPAQRREVQPSAPRTVTEHEGMGLEAQTVCML